MRRFRPAVALAALAALAACQDSATDSRATDQQLQGSLRPEGFATPSAVHNGYIIDRDGKPLAIAYEVHGGNAIWNGDINLGPAERVSASVEEALRTLETAAGIRLGVAIDGSTYRWPGGVVPYVIPAGFPSPSRITDAINYIEANTTGVDFVVRTTQANYIQFRTSTGCASYVGRVGGRQYVDLASGCGSGNVAHELLHVLGLFHEHTRCDRDTYVLINTANITTGYSGNFTKQCTNATDYSTYSEGSIMHYGPYAFSKNGQPTIVSLRGLDSQMGQRSSMSSSDVSTVNTLYP